jgi:hypothetical protein
VIHIRQRDLTEQLMELQGLHGKNSAVIKNMRSRISQEQSDFDLGSAKIHALRSVHMKLLREVFSLLGPKSLKKEMLELTAALQQKGIKLGVKRAYDDTFNRLRANLHQVQSTGAEIESMLAATFRQLNAEHGFSLQAPSTPSLERHLQDLDLVETGHLQYLGINNVFRLAQADFSNRLVRALATRLRVIHEAALGDIELWSKSAAAQLDTQLRERRRSFMRRIEAIDRIHQASGGLDDRICEVQAQETGLNQLKSKLAELTNYFVAATKPSEPEITCDIAVI